MDRTARALRTILTPDQLSRIKPDAFTGRGYTVDVHGLTRRKAERLLKNIILAAREPITLRVIHGFHKGTVLKEAMRESFCDKIERSEPVEWNRGQTWLYSK